MKKIILLLPLLFSVNAFAAQSPEWWKQSTCKQEKSRQYMLMMKRGATASQASERTENDFKTCICSSSEETKSGIDSLLGSYEIEIMYDDRMLNIPIEHGRDFGIMSVDNQCYLEVTSFELCQNAGFMAEASQSFRVFQKYDAGKNLCVTDVDNKFFKGKNSD